MNLYLDIFLASSWIFGQALSTSLMNEMNFLVIIIVVIIIIIIIIFIIIITVIITNIYSGSINGSSPYKLKKI